MPDPVTCPAARADIAIGAGSADDLGRILAGLTAPRISNAADIAFQGRGTGGACNVYIRRSVDGSIQTIVARGDPAPVDGEATFRCLGAPAITSGGTVAFPAAYLRASKPRQGQGIFLAGD